MRDPNLTEQEPFFWAGEGAAFEHTEDEGQSPQEQPSEVSPQEYVETFIGFISEESGVDLKLIAYGDPGAPGAALLPINVYHSVNIGTQCQQTYWDHQFCSQHRK